MTELKVQFPSAAVLPAWLLALPYVNVSCESHSPLSSCMGLWCGVWVTILWWKLLGVLCTLGRGARDLLRWHQGAYYGFHDDLVDPIDGWVHVTSVGG